MGSTEGMTLERANLALLSRLGRLLATRWPREVREGILPANLTKVGEAMEQARWPCTPA